MRVVVRASQTTIQSDSITTVNWASIELIFILANAASGHNFIFHIDVYQKKQNIGIAEDLWNLPMTKKVVMNAIVSTGLCMDPNGFHELYMNNCYSAPELFVMLKAKYKTLTCGTVWTNRKCWEKNVMNLSKLATRGNSKIFYIPINGLIFGQ